MKARLLTASVCLSLCALLPAAAGAQALTSLSSVRVGYTTRKNTVKPQGELKAQIDALDAQIAEASRLGKNGELRRLFAKGINLLNGRAWTPEAEYMHSIVLRTDRVVADSARPYTVRLEQIFAPSLDLQRTVSAHVTLRQRPAPPAPGQPQQEPPLVKDLGAFDGVARDLRESPFPFELDVKDVADGSYMLVAEVSDQATSLGAADAFVLNVAACGGVTGTRRFIVDCKRVGARFWFYGGDLGIATACALHIAAAAPSVDLPSQSLLRWYTDDVIAQGPFVPEGGLVSVPTGPGLGVDLDEAAVARGVERFARDGEYDLYQGPALPRY